jgi:hypothetical protein
MPLFYCHDQSLQIGTQKNKMLPIFPVFKHFKRIKDFKRIESTILGASQAYLTQTHIQFLINWIMRNENNPVMKQFHVLPMEVIAHLTFLFEGKNTSSDMMVIDRYCCDNWQKLWSFMFFLYKILVDVAVNPFQMINQVVGAGPNISLIYGFFHIDPMEVEYCNGTTPCDDGTNAQWHVKEMLFLLNCMSWYCDLHLHNILDQFVPQETTEYILAMGSLGPMDKFLQTKLKLPPKLFGPVIPY